MRHLPSRTLQCVLKFSYSWLQTFSFWQTERAWLHVGRASIGYGSFSETKKTFKSWVYKGMWCCCWRDDSAIRTVTDPHTSAEAYSVLFFVVRSCCDQYTQKPYYGISQIKGKTFHWKMYVPIYILYQRMSGTLHDIVIWKYIFLINS